jgi:hypothetical protein
MKHDASPDEQRLIQLKWEMWQRRDELRRIRRTLRKHRPSMILKLLRLFQWASQPSAKTKPGYSVPGIGLDVMVFALFVGIGVANLIV